MKRRWCPKCQRWNYPKDYNYQIQPSFPCPRCGCVTTNGKGREMIGTWVRVDKEGGAETHVTEAYVRERVAGVYQDVASALKVAQERGLSVENAFALYYFKAQA
jgi:hypothetical protein